MDASAMIDNDVPSREYAKVLDELFEYLDSLSEDERYKYIINQEMRSMRNTRIDSRLRYIPTYFIPRLLDDKISKESFKVFITRLFRGEYQEFARSTFSSTIILHKGWASLFLKLVIDGVYTRDEMLTFLDEMDNLFNPSPSDISDQKSLVVSNYRPPSLPDGFPSDSSYGQVLVYVSKEYWNTVLFTGVTREIIGVLTNTVSHQELILLYDRLVLILGRRDSATVVLLPCVALISEIALTDLMTWLVTRIDRYELFAVLYCSGNTNDEHSLVEKTLVTLDDSVLSIYSDTNSAYISRARHLIRMRTDDV